MGKGKAQSEGSLSLSTKQEFQPALEIRKPTPTEIDGPLIPD